MFRVLSGAWALFLGMMLLQVGNGMQGTVLGLRGVIEGFSTLQLSVIMSCYFVGFLFGSRMAPQMIRRVGHVRVFAALGSMISAVMILYPTVTDPWAWSVGRVVIGFCFSGVFVTAESWLNNSASNGTRGKALSLYMIVQMIGLVSAQGLIVLADPAGYVLFVIPCVLVSLSFAPILLSVGPTPSFDTTKPLSLLQILKISPLGCVGMFLTGGVFAAQFGMAAVYGAEAGLSVGQISIFVASFYTAALLAQYPLGWLSDRMDRRWLILGVALVGALSTGVGAYLGVDFRTLLVLGFIMGGMALPLYSLFIAYTNDFLEVDDMAAASGGLVFVYGIGAIGGPFVIGQMMDWLGPEGFWFFLSATFAATVLWAAWRMTRRSSVPVDETGAYLGVSPTSTPVAVAAAQDWYVETAEAEDSTGDEPPRP
jgi:MFS family permease